MDYFSGTSFAAPHVSGTIAYLRYWGAFQEMIQYQLWGFLEDESIKEALLWDDLKSENNLLYTFAHAG